MKIITISREFGSGGRELGKRLADLLGFDYYDREIIQAVATRSGIDEGYAQAMLETPAWKKIPLHFHSSFAGVAPLQPEQMIQTNLLLEQRRVIEAVAESGRDCVIVGRNADILLRDYQPFNIFVCAQMEAKVRRCEERAPEGETLTRRELERKIRSIDKARQQTRDIISGSRWGERGSYHLTVNTTEWEIKELVPAVAEFANRWFARTR